MESDPGLATHTIYRPADLGALGDYKLPIVVWGNGACANAGKRFRWFLTCCRNRAPWPAAKRRALRRRAR
jgi:hypothetical protein